MAGLVKSTKGNSLSTPGAGETSGSQVRGGKYLGEKVTYWENYPELRAIMQPEPESQSDMLTSITIRRQGLHFQKKKAWIATRAGIAQAVLLRPLALLGDGKKMKPNGDWFVSEHTTHTAAKTPSIRQGIIQNSYAKDDTSSTSSPSSFGPSNPHDAVSEQSLSMLPDEVQRPVRSLMKHNPDHTFIGSCAGISTPDGCIYDETVKILVVAGNTGLVINAQRAQHQNKTTDPDQARRNLNTVPWNVRQITYELGKAPDNMVTGSQKKGLQR